MKAYFLSLFMLVALSATAQEYKPFKVNVSLGIAKPMGSGASGGVLFAVEPKYGLNDHIDLGLRLELAAVARGVVSNGNTSSGEVGSFTSAVVTGNYLFGQGGVRPFLGLGLGLYNVASGGTITVVNGQGPQSITLVGETKFGAMFRAGLKAGHFVIGAEFNAVPTTTSTVSIGSTSVESKNTYLGIKLGFDIGGGRR